MCRTQLGVQSRASGSLWPADCQTAPMLPYAPARFLGSRDLEFLGFWLKAQQLAELEAGGVSSVGNQWETDAPPEHFLFLDLGVEAVAWLASQTERRAAEPAGG